MARQSRATPIDLTGAVVRTCRVGIEAARDKCKFACNNGSDSYVERPGLQDLSLVEQGMTVRSYVRPVKRRLAAGHDDIRGSNRPINFSRSKRSESGGLIATGNVIIQGSSRFAPCLT
jgi:hypothetical protein